MCVYIVKKLVENTGRKNYTNKIGHSKRDWLAEGGGAETINVVKIQKKLYVGIKMHAMELNMLRDNGCVVWGRR